MEQSRPLSLAELIARARPTGYSVKEKFKTSLHIALGEVKAGQSAKDTGDIEWAFVHFAKAHIILAEELPTHPRYSILEPFFQNAVISKGHEVETWLEETRALIKRRILAWENRHSDVPSIPRPRVYSDSGVNRVRPRLKTSSKGAHLLSPSRSDPPLPTSPSDKSSVRGHKRASSDIYPTSSRDPNQDPAPSARHGTLSTNIRAQTNTDSPSQSSQPGPAIPVGAGIKTTDQPKYAQPTPIIVIRKATESLENLEDITPVESTKSIDGPASSVAAEEENTVPSLIFTDYPEGPDPSLSSPEDPISILTPKDSVASPVVEIYRDPMGPASPGLFDSTRVRTLSETHGTAAVDAKTPVSPEQRPLSCPPVVTDQFANKRNNLAETTSPATDNMTTGTVSEFFTAPLALEEALMKGMDVSSDPEHPESIAKMEEEAVSYLELEQFERATNILLEVLKLRCRIQGESHLFTIQTMSNLGIGYEGQGKLDQAIEVLLVTLKQLKHSHSATNLRFQRSIKERLEELTKRHEEAKRMMTIVRSSNLKRYGPRRNNSLDQIATRVRFDEDLPLHIDVNTTPEAIMAHLTNRRCPNLTELLDTLECSKVPVNRGGFGDIWQGKLTDGRSIAMKRIYQGERKLNKRLAQELYAWSKANHQNVLELLGLAYYKDYLVMVSPWMRYGSVHEYLEKHPESNRLHLAIQVADGIEHLHRIGMASYHFKSS
ncbi:Protein kinase domain [Rhizoctonia solani]|uniref:Protein kinase domain n=1 Tax=Rhizoctonia solani TaxID=456999 RepID=A0A8H7LGL4_9AGAM|nr:Protein kinase domain [Rhizoctonia solani]